MKFLTVGAGVFAGLVGGTALHAQGVELGIEMPYLSVFANHGAGEIDGGNAFFDDPNSAAAFRITGEYGFANGVGVRSTYFEFEGDFETEGDIFDTASFDVEAIFEQQLGSASLEFFGGLRAAELEWSDENQDIGFEFAGVGPTFGTEFSQSFGQNFGFSMSGRYSALFGQIEALADDGIADNVMVPTFDLRMGMDYSYALSNSGAIDVGFGIESRTHLSLSGNVDDEIDPEDVDVTIAGPYFQAAYKF
ncbi:Lpg1974 family pore-forming outer membrane protein [Yoonia sp. BS5-3]|uniref:Lpg1974 family pore-forming outer membrane protein n=1 Tax=Yoonia phaeophyticola TaxID=3137369 RepID=A0ABZ2V7P6_9RHOB